MDRCSTRGRGGSLQQPTQELRRLCRASQRNLGGLLPTLLTHSYPCVVAGPGALCRESSESCGVESFLRPADTAPRCEDICDDGSPGIAHCPPCYCCLRCLVWQASVVRARMLETSTDAWQTSPGRMIGSNSDLRTYATVESVDGELTA